MFMDEATESGSGFIGTDDSVFKGTMGHLETGPSGGSGGHRGDPFYR